MKDGGDFGLTHISVITTPKYTKKKCKCKWKKCGTILNGYRAASGYIYCSLHHQRATEMLDENSTIYTSAKRRTAIAMSRKRLHRLISAK